MNSDRSEHFNRKRGRGLFRRKQPGASRQHLAAVDDDGLPRDPAGEIGGEEDGHVRHFLGRAEPRPGDRAQDRVVEVGVAGLAILPHATRKLDGARRDRIHPDLFRRQHEGLAHGVVDQGRLHGRVRRRAGAACVSGDRGDIQDHAGAGLLQIRDGRMGRPYRRHNVDVEPGGPAGLVVRRAEARGVVDQDVDAAERGRCGGDIGVDRLLIREVAGDGMRGDTLGRDLLAGSLERRGPACADGDGGANGREAQRDGAPDTLTAARHHDALALHADLHLSVSATLPFKGERRLAWHRCRCTPETSQGSRRGGKYSSPHAIQKASNTSKIRI